MGDAITGKVAAIIDDTTLVLNLGAGDGVREGMAFAGFAAFQEIADPDSGESLGNWEMEKARVVVEYVQERLCTVRSLLAVDVERPGTLSAMMVQHSFGNFGQGSEQREKLEIRAAAAAGRPQSQPIAVGDGARLLAPESEAEERRDEALDAPDSDAGAEPNDSAAADYDTASTPEGTVDGDAAR